MRAASLAVIVSAAALTGCYVVPVQPAYPPHGAPPTSVGAPPAVPVTFAARLYPANDLAAGVGLVSAVVTNDLNGRGSFSTAIGGESFSGEATRHPGTRQGLANGAGNRGGYIRCTYQMNSATLGSGTCKLSNGALFNMHVGQ